MATDNCLKNRTRIKVLIVDSEAKVCELIALMLQESELEIVEKRDFEDFQSLVDVEKPNLVIIDPAIKQGKRKSNFFKVFMEKVDKKEIKFLLLGPPECKKDYEGLKIKGWVNYCVKPFTSKEINLEIHKLINELGA